MTTEQKLREALEKIQDGASKQGPFTGMGWREVQEICAEALAQPLAPGQQAPQEEAARPEPELTLPEPAFRLRWDAETGRYRVSKPNIGDTDVYTAEQVRALLADSKAAGEPVSWEYRLRIRSWSDEWSQWYRTTAQANKERDQSRDSQWEYETRTLYTRPQQQAKPLTEKEIDQKLQGRSDFYKSLWPVRSVLYKFIQVAERAHGIGDQA